MRLTAGYLRFLKYSNGVRWSRRRRHPRLVFFLVLVAFPSMPLFPTTATWWPLHERVRVQRVLDLLRLQRRRQLQRQQRLHHVVAVRRRRRALPDAAAGAVNRLAAVEEVVALHDEGLHDGLVQLGGGQRVLVLEVGAHQRGPEADGQVVGRHQDRLAVLAHPEGVETGR